jgi:hypothetical protein
MDQTLRGKCPDNKIVGTIKRREFGYSRFTMRYF